MGKGRMLPTKRRDIRNAEIPHILLKVCACGFELVENRVPEI